MRITKPTDKGKSQPVNEEERRATAAALLAEAYGHLVPALTAQVCLALLAVIVFWGHVPATILLPWLAALWLITGLRYRLYRGYRQNAGHEGGGRWTRLFLLGLFASGLAWGSAGLLFFPEGSTSLQIFLALLLGGLVDGAAITVAPLQNPLRIFIVMLLAPIAARLYLTGGDTPLTLGLMLLLNGGVCWVMSNYVHRMLMASLRHRFRRLQEIERRKTSEENISIYKRNLERLVFERTQALSRSNEELFQEILERKKAEEEKARMVAQLLEAQKMEAIGTLAGGIAHDFNNILNIIIGFTELALEDLPDKSRLKTDLEEVYKAGQRGRDLVRQILSFSRNERQKPTQVKPTKLIEEVHTLLRATIPASVEIRTDLDHESGSILVDPNQMHRVLTNLATNAVHAMEEHGVLTFKVDQVRLPDENALPKTDLRPRPYIRIMVSDTGCGISEETKKRIFEPFFTTKEVGKGSGMGLAVVHGIVSANQGVITVESEPGEGATFLLFFPAVDLPVEAAAPADRQPLPGTERILVVDDDRAIARMTNRLLSSQGYRVTVSCDSSEALGLFRGTPDAFDLIISDQTMPGLTGLEFAREIHRLRPQIPLILCTGYSSKVSEESLTAAGITSIMMKPFDRQELTGKVRLALEKTN